MNVMTSPRPGRLLAGFLLLTVIWGTTWAVIRVGLGGVPPLTGVALRFTIAGGLLLALAPRFGVRFGRSRRELGLWTLNGLLSFCISYSIVYWSEQYIPSGLAAVLFATYPLFVAVFAHFGLPGERLGRAAVGGLLLGFAGVAVIFSDDLHQLGGERATQAALVMLVAPLVSAVASVAVKRWGSGIHPLSMAAVPMLLSGVVMGLVSRLAERGVPVVLDGRSLSALLYLAILGSAVTFTIYYWLLANMPAMRLALMSYLIPIVAVAVGALVFDEPLRPRLLAGSALVLAGVLTVNLRWRPRALAEPGA
jgi:drug/metabolite transporter (DMT)-like permease